MKTRRGPAGRGASRKSRSLSWLVPERFEDRVLLTVFQVTNTSDMGAGSFRQAIIDSNASSTALPNQIRFDNLSGVTTISPQSTFPAITQQVVIDGTSIGGYNAANPRPLLGLNGSNPLLAAGPALTVSSPNVSIKSIGIVQFNGAGVLLNGGTDLVSGCYIGVGPGGANLLQNTGEGITISSQNNTIGGTTPADRNVISGNRLGIHATGNAAGSNLIQGNFIGTDATGLSKLGNTFEGIQLNTPNNTIGGSSAIANNVISGAGNVVSGNFAGITISSTAATGNTIQGNFIGTDATGNGSIPNTFDGLDISGVRNTLVGGPVSVNALPTDMTVKNVISANGFDGIQVSSSTAFNNRIQGNFIGIGINGVTPLGNGGHGVNINGSNNTLVGGTVLSGTMPDFGNTIAYNGTTFNQSNGVFVSGGQNSGQNDGILSNRIFSNGGLGIRLSGGNQGVQPPAITSVQSGAAQTRVIGTYSDPRFPSTSFRLQFFSNQNQDPSGFGEGQFFLGDFDIVTDAAGNASFSTVLQQGVPVGDFVTATATQQVLQVNNTSQFSADVPVTQAQVTNLGVKINVPSGGPLLNQPYTYAVAVTNLGPNDATGVVLTDTLPTNSTFVSSSAGTVVNGILTANIGNLAANATTTVMITVRPTSVAGTFTNTATVNGNELDTDISNNTDTTTSQVSSTSDLSATLSVDANPAPVGSPINFTLVVGNNGPSTVNKAVATITLPANLTNIVVSPDQGTYTISGNVVTINLGILPGSTGSTTTITATPTATGTFTATASVTSELSDPDGSNNTSNLQLAVANAAELAIDMFAQPNPVLTGQELFYTITVTNNGPSTATGAVVTDALPAGLNFVLADSNAGGNGVISIGNGVVTVNLNPLDPGVSTIITIAVIPTISGQVTNTATVSNSVEIDADTSNNTVSTITQVSPADLNVNVINPGDPLVVGTDYVFQVVVTNNGPATATNVILTDDFGTGAIIVGSSAGSAQGGKLVANLGSIASGASMVVTITARPTVSGNLIDSATVTSDQLDPNPTDNSSISSNLVGPVDLAVSVVAAPNPVLIGGQVVYIVTVTNNGPTAASNVIFNDILPDGAILNSATSSQGQVAVSSANSVTGNLGTIAPGGFVQVVILVTTTTVSTATDTASVTSDGFETNLADNTGSAAVSVINLPGAIVLGTPLVFAPENSGFVTLTLNRVGGTLGVVSVNYATADFTGLAGVNYTSSSGIVTFLDGQTTATITIPVLDDNVINGSTGFFVVIGNPTGGAVVAEPTIAAVIVTNTDRDTIPPSVVGLVAIPDGSSIDGFVIFFSEPMDPIRASLVSNYHVFNAGGNGETPVELAAANYNPFNNSVTLVPTKSLPSNTFYHIVANGSVGLVLTDTSGNSLSGFAGQGSNFDVFYGQGNSLSYRDSGNNAVSIKLTGGGTMAVFRGQSGEIASLNLYGVVPHKTKLMGTVKKLSKTSTGHTTINAINGLGNFGDVVTNLTTPPFYVISAPVTYTALTGPTSVTAAAITTGKKTPTAPRFS